MSDEKLNKEAAAAAAEVPVSDDKKTLKDVVLDGLEEKGKGNDHWLWVLFILCITPNIINGFHISSYVFLSKVPESYFCLVPALNHKNYSNEQIREIAVPGGLNISQSCEVYKWDYEKLADLTFEQAKFYIKDKAKPEVKTCFEMKETDDDYAFHYDQAPEVSFVPEWNLVCERKAMRSNVQVALSIGKFVGASTFGIISDKYGRKSAFSLAAVLYIFSGLLTTFAPTYIFIILGRIGLGFCGSGVFYSLFTLITENSGTKYRSSLSIAYNFSYPLGFLFLAFAAYITPHWRDLSLILTIPSFLLIIHLIWLVESPRYLISKGKYKKAYKMLYRKKPSVDYLLELQCDKEAIIEPDDETDKKKVSFDDKVKQCFNEVIKIYGPSNLRQKALICHFTWCVTSLTYYMLALNAENFKANIYVWTGLTGTVDIAGYIVSIFILKWSTRRMSQFTLFVLAGAFLLMVLGISKEKEYVLLVFAMMSRFCITSVYAIMTLHTAEMFPTEIRNSVLGISSTAAHFGSFFAPYIVDLLGPLAWYIPTTICGTLVVLAGFFTLFQPETKGQGLTDHVEDEEEQSKLANGNDVEMNKKN